jgi:hypothetical protein
VVDRGKGPGGSRVGALAAAVLLLAPIQAVPVAVSGFVRDAQTGESLAYVTVVLAGTRWGGVTDPSGHYALAGIPPGAYALRVQSLGYVASSDSVVLGTRDLVRHFRLVPQAVEMGGTVVEARRTESGVSDVAPGRTLLQIRELRAAPAAIEADPIRAVQTLPGVATLSDFSVGLYVRGGTPDQNLILLDGADLYNVDHLFGLFSTFPADATKSAELLRGGFPARYGDRLSSVLNVVSSEGNKEQFQGSAGASLLASRLTLQGPVGRGSYLVSGRRTHLDPLLALAGSRLGARWLRYNFYDLQAKTHQVLSDADQVTVSSYGGNDALAYRFERFDFDVQWGNRALSSRWTHVFNSQFIGNLVLAGSRFASETRFNTEDVRMHERNRLADQSLRCDLAWAAGAAHAVEVGWLAKRLQSRYAFGEATQEWMDVAVHGYQSAAYVQDEWRLTPLFAAQAGLRYSRAGNGGYSGWDPRLSLRYQVGDDTYLKAAVGEYRQYLFRLSREFQGISLLSSIWVMADSTAAPSRATHGVVGLETRVLGLDLDLEAWCKSYRGLYELNYDNVTSVRIGDILRRGSGRAWGADLLTKRQSGRHSGWLSVSTGISERTIAGLNPDADGTPRPFHSKFDRRFQTNLVYSWQLGRRWTLSTRAAAASGQPYTQVLGRGEVELQSGLRYTFNDLGSLNGVRLPAYQRLDLGVEHRFRCRSWDITASLQVVNVTNHHNVFNYFWDPEGEPANSDPGVRHQISMLPLLPSLGLDVDF